MAETIYFKDKNLTKLGNIVSVSDEFLVRQYRNHADKYEEITKEEAEKLLNRNIEE